MILRHELVHIRRLDMVWAIMMWVVVCIHWYNPLVWWLNGEFTHVRELSCDEETLRDYTRSERQAYVRLLYRQMAEGQEVKYGMAMAGKVKQYRERLENAMNMDKKNLGVAGVLGIVAMVLLNTMTVFAYPEVSRVDMSDLDELPKMEEVTRAEWIFIPEEYAEENPYLAMLDMEILYEYQFVDEEGNIYELTEAQFNGESTERVVCNHDYKTGQSTMHVNLPDGGCIVYVYESERCILCGDVKKTEQVSKHEYKKCPHDL